MCFCTIDLAGWLHCRAHCIAAFPGLVTRPTPLERPFVFRIQMIAAGECAPFFSFRRQYIKRPNIDWIAVFDSIWKWSYGWWILQMAACFIKVKNNAELDLHVTKYDKNYCEIRIFLFERRIIDRCSMWLGRALRSMILSLLFPRSDHCVAWDNLSNQPEVPHLSSSLAWWIDSYVNPLAGRHLLRWTTTRGGQY